MGPGGPCGLQINKAGPFGTHLSSFSYEIVEIRSLLNSFLSFEAYLAAKRGMANGMANYAPSKALFRHWSPWTFSCYA